MTKRTNGNGGVHYARYSARDSSPDFATFLNQLSASASRVSPDDELNADERTFLIALVRELRSLAELHNVTPADRMVITAIGKAVANNGGAAVMREAIATQLDLAGGPTLTPYSLTKSLQRAESRGLAKRPRGGKSKFWTTQLHAIPE